MTNRLRSAINDAVQRLSYGDETAEASSAELAAAAAEQEALDDFAVVDSMTDRRGTEP